MKNYSLTSNVLLTILYLVTDSPLFAAIPHLLDPSAAVFRTAWYLPSTIKVVGSNN
ncbi:MULTISPECIES: hypothetical protein [unclassified Spirosoma]|uniref:hypothetical protein n=1 Tax=unclassified Spirosoma TaxID=2621999 RepID=UPI000AA15B30|nr:MULTISPECIES: hypothetical protein [unclassified Spirosoma]MBN8826061.1 hypothetical protein [Spirosoma sp.]